MKATLFSLCVPVVAGALLAGQVIADQRSYVWTYQYGTVPTGQGEIETYFTLSAPDQGDLEGKVSTEHKVELEVGMTEHFDFAIYQVFSQAPDEGLAYDGFQLRARYRIGEKGKYVVDPLLYLEYQGVPDFAEHGVEAKLILAKDIGRFNIALNPILEAEFGGDENTVEAEYALGMSYGVNRSLRMGIEAKGDKDSHYVGPVIAHGGERFWVTLGSAFRVLGDEEADPEFQMRLLLGIGL